MEPLPIVRRGLTTALADHGFDVEEPEDVAEWVACCRDIATAVVVRVQRDGDIELMTELRAARPDLVVVALLEEPTFEDYRRMLRSGATAVAGLDAPPDRLADVVEAAMSFRTILPHPIAAQLAATGTSAPEVELTSREIDWLRILAAGATHEQLADRAGYSPRQMSRLLRSLYARLGASNRPEALVKASRWGLIEV
jgi:DNA-binding NarL/FixJ family response regulator